ncbi:MAG: metallophosphoesterase [Promethearchaeota archaeon]
MNNKEIKERQEAVIINPNLGRPIFINIDPKLKTKKFQTEILFISNIKDPKEFEKNVKGKIKLVPILDYRWKFRKLFQIKGKKEEVKKKGFWGRRKKRKLITKAASKGEKDYDFKVEDIDYKLKKLKVHSYRGDALSSSVLNIAEMSTVSMTNLQFIETMTPQDYLLKYGNFGNLNKFYKTSIEVALSKEIRKFLKTRNFVMFDIVYSKININYHSIVVSKQEWNNFSFVHATDLHLAERNDRIYGIVKNWTASSIKKNVDEFINIFRKKLKIKKMKEDQKESLTELEIPLRKRLINPNNQFRKFIKIMNRRVLKNDIDFIVITGDLVDFTVLSRLSKKVRKIGQFEYNESNWKIFKQIVLNSKDEKHYKGVIKGEELLCPILTIVGNHDFRPYHYDITWAEMYKKIGLNAAEAVALNELFSASPITALVKTSMALKGYLSEINPSLDFSLFLGNNNFIFLNTGSDSFKNFKDLIMGHPSVTGLLNKQILFLENLINHKIKEGTNTFLFLHGPPINTGEKKIKIKLFEKKGSRIIKNKVEDFKESILKKLGKIASKARIDGSFNVKYGTVSSNWEKLIEFCKDHCLLTLAGHTHTLREYRLEDPETKTKVYAALPFSLKKIENPAAVFFDDYSEILTDAETIQTKSPFVVQTPALGLGGYRNPETAGAYREVFLKDGKLTSFKVRYIHR